MKKTIVVLVWFLALPLLSQVRFSGSLQSSFYAFDTPLVEQANFYQALQLRLAPTGSLYLNTYARVAKIGEDDWNERVYNLYLNWAGSNNRLGLRAGRQFLYHGVMNGTYDGALVTLKPFKPLKLKLFGGIEAPFDRSLELLEWDEGNALGGHLSYALPGNNNLDLSYFQRKRNDVTVWNLAGAALHGKFQDVYYQAEYDYNLETERYQGMRYRLGYYLGKWAFSGEYSQQKPRIFEDSYFRIFRAVAYSQLRSGVTYQWGEYQLGAQYLFTDYETAESNQAIFSLGNSWGFVGFVLQDGFGGDNAGIYGNIRYDLFPQLTIKLFSSYYNFEHYTTQISEDATAFSGGFDFRPFKSLSLQAEVQESINSYYDNDVRGLFRLFYYFRR